MNEQEFWYARDLQVALEYTEWRNFCKVIDKAKEACRGSNNAVSEHFVDINKSSLMPNGDIRKRTKEKIKISPSVGTPALIRILF